ncbi:helix-turn-helix domain-containing protein [Streptantibioticus parmotrematis]|uniref:helix-turn-helix domain-containing protein n=1 Tax=Streptantibioticus parmotrematis TaxID=2873249 RepID=UPI0034112897
MLEQPHAFGTELRRLRVAAGWSLTRLARQVHYSKGQLSKVETGLKRPSAELARLCDTELSAKGALVDLASRQPPSTIPPAPDADGEVWVMRMDKDGPGSFQPMGRRGVMAAGAASVFALSLGGTQARSRAENTSLLDVSRSLFDEFRRLGQVAGPATVLPGVIAQTHALRETAAASGPRTRGELLTLGARYAEFTGWMAQESGDDTAALWWTERAVELAAAGGDHGMAAYALTRRALVAFYRHDAQQTIALARRAQSGTPPPRIAGLAAQHEAQGHALAGDRAACLRSLDRARRLLADADDDPSWPVIGTSHIDDPAAMATGWCLYDLGRPREAAEVLDREVARIPADATRNRARYGVRRALAHAAAGDIDHACVLTGRLLPVVSTVDSATIDQDMARLTRVLSRFPTHQAVRELSPYLPRKGTSS